MSWIQTIQHHSTICCSYLKTYYMDNSTDDYLLTFTEKALDDIYKESTGIPRRINRICEKSLMYASQQGKRLIDEHLVRYIIEHEMLGKGRCLYHRIGA